MAGISHRPSGLYDWIRSNDSRSIFLFVGFLIAVQAVFAMVLFLPLVIIDPFHAPFIDWAGYLRRYAPIVLVGAVGWFAWQFFWHIETVKQAVGFEFVDETDEPRLCSIIEPLIIAMGLPVPFVAVIEDNARNAFACGIGRKKAVVVVTRGLLKDLTDDELGCVLAHELSHIKNGDIRLMAAANIFMASLTALHRNNPLRFTPLHVVLALAIPVVLPLTLAGSFVGHLALRAGQVSRLMIASSREYLADALAVQLTKNPAALASALVKVEHHHRVKYVRREDDAMMIAGETTGENATHPTVAQRIAALTRVTGSMVFNAPGAIREEQWSASTTLSEAKTAALLNALPKAYALPRVSVGAKENWFGLTFAGKIMLLLTIVALGYIHFWDLGSPRAMAAKFDIGPVTKIIGIPVSCNLGVTSTDICSQQEAKYIWRDFEGQKNTLAGMLAESSKNARAELDSSNRENPGISWNLMGLVSRRRDDPQHLSYNKTEKWPVSTLAISMDGQGLKTTSRKSALFDVDGNGKLDRTGWIEHGDGLIIHDVNGNGQVDGREELMGSTGIGGFQMLKQFDSNVDGKISAEDERWGELAIWIDGGVPGKYENGELRTFSAANIASISLDVEELNAYTPDGTDLKGESMVTFHSNLDRSYGSSSVAPNKNLSSIFETVFRRESIAQTPAKSAM